MTADTKITVGLDPQDIYDNAIVIAAAFDAMATNLRESGAICTHPPESTTTADDVMLCTMCGRVVPFARPTGPSH